MSEAEAKGIGFGERTILPGVSMLAELVPRQIRDCSDQRDLHFELVPACVEFWMSRKFRKVDARLPGKGNSNSHGTRPVHLIITMIKWIRTSRLSMKNIAAGPSERCGLRFRV